MAHLSILKHTKDTLDSIKADVLAVGIFENGSLTKQGQAIDTLLDDQISKAQERGDINGKHCETTTFYSKHGPVIVIGLGKVDDFQTECLRKVGGTLAKKPSLKNMTMLHARISVVKVRQILVRQWRKGSSWAATSSMII